MLYRLKSETQLNSIEDRQLYLLFLVSGEGNIKLRQNLILLCTLQLLLVDIILVLMSAAEKHDSFPNLLSYKQQTTQNKRLVLLVN